MNAPLLTVELRREADIVLARQRARQVAALLGFDAQDQSRITTAVSEIVRNALVYGGGGRMRVAAARHGGSSALHIEIVDQGPGIERLADVLAGRWKSKTGMGLGIVGARRLMDAVEIDSGPHRGTRAALVKALPPGTPALDAARLQSITAALARQTPTDAYGEIHAQHQELLAALAALQERQDDLERLNRELVDTNRGVVALYAELDERAESLQRADQTKNLFLSSVSHELRTPLNSIRSLARLLDDRVDGPLTDEQQRQVRFIHKAADDLGQMVDDLLDLAKIEAGKADVRTEPVSIPNVWSALRGMMRPLLTHPEVALVFDEPPEITVDTDEGKLAQVLRNLVSNAIKYTERGEVRASARLDGEQLVLTVRDTGIGIAAEHQAAIFEDFVQLDSPLHRRHKGTGLGLPLCRRLAELLGGTIALDSAPGEGSCFTVTLPCRLPGAPHPAHRADAPDLAPVPDRGAPGGAPAERAVRTVLLVDDDARYRYLLRRALGDAVTVHEAADGAEGLARARALAPDAIVLDLNMPVMSGDELLAQLRSERPTGPPRAVVLSAQRLGDAERRALQALDAQVLHKSEAAAAQLRRLLGLE